MLSIAVARSADYYARLAQVGYYAAAPEKPGAWYGKGAERLSFTGEISDLSAFKKVFEGLHPEGGKLVQNAGKENRKNAWDLTFSAPKSFSVLWAIANEQERNVLEGIERRAVESALNEATNHVVTRTGKGGVVREQCDVIFALFPHSTSRAEEPQRHTHCLLMNIGVRANGKTGALETADLFRMKMTLGALYRAELSRLMEHEYGLSFERVKNSIELLGRDKPLCEFYSTRSKEIEGFMKENGLQGATLAAKACTETRSRKDMEKGIDEHLRRWVREADEQGVTYEKLFGDMRRAHLAKQVPQSQLKSSAEERKTAVLAGLIHTVNERLFKEHSHFSQFRLFQTVAEESQLLGLTLEEIRSVKTTIQKSLIFLHRERNGVEHYTTARTLSQEKSLIANAEKLSEDNAHVVRAHVRKEYLSSKLSDEQKLAFLHVTEPGRLKIVEGLAGTGKTTFLREANRAWMKEGYTTIGVSLAAIAAENLKAEAGIQDAKSLAKFFIEHEKGTAQVDRKTVIVLDEAAMVGTHDLKKLTDICLATGAKTVWVGDRSQLQSIAPGGGFAGVADRFGKAELNEIWRQQGSHEWGRKVVYDAAKGAVTQTLAKLNEEGKLEFSENQKGAREALIAAWEIEKTDDLKETLILTSTVDEAERLNRLAQAVLLKEGKIKSDRPSATVNSAIFYEGDRLMFRKNDQFLRVKNGECGVVEQVSTSGKLTVRLDSGERRHFDPKCYDQITLAYASTTHKAQGQTKDKTYILVDEGMIDKEMFYVQISRQRFDVRLFINGQGEERSVAYDEFLRRVSRSNQEVLAHDLAKKLRHEERARQSLTVKKSKEIAKITGEKNPPTDVPECLVSAREIAQWYTREVYHPAKEQERFLKQRLQELSSVDPKNWDQHIKEVIFDGEYQKTQVALESAEYALRQCRHKSKRVIDEGRQKGWLHRAVSREYKESLRFAEREVKEWEEKTKALRQKAEYFATYLNSLEGEKRYLEVKGELEQKHNEVLSERKQLQGKIEKLGLYQILATLSQLSGLKEEKLSVKKGGGVRFDRQEIEEQCRSLAQRVQERAVFVGRRIS